MQLQAVETLFEIEKEEAVRSKKEIILSLYKQGTTEIESIAALSGAKPSYIGSVLQREGLIDNYFDLYTSTAHPMNIYSKQFRGKLGFRDVMTARRSVSNLEEAYHEFEEKQDRAGQHHTLEMGLTMLDRARWTGKLEEAEVYRHWLLNKLSRPLIRTTENILVKPEKTGTEEVKEQTKLKLVA